MAGRRVLLILSLVPALRSTAGAQSLPLIENQLGHGRIDVPHTVKPN